MASAWGHVAAMTTMVALSWLIGKKKYPVRYRLEKLSVHTIIFVLFVAVIFYLPPSGDVFRIILYDAVLVTLTGVVYLMEKRNLSGKKWETE